MFGKTFKCLNAKAEREVNEYVKVLEGEYLGFGAGLPFRSPFEEGGEVFSLTRNSDMTAKNYLDHYFDNGIENEKSE